MCNNLLIAQSGGPTVAINATLVGILKRAKVQKEIGKVYGARYGIKGILSENIFNLEHKLQDNMQDILLRTPAAALGSCRYKLNSINSSELEYERILNIFKKYKIKYFIYIGGNDSMDTVQKLSEYFKIKNINDIFIIGAPKTIDNDLFGTDHTPGFGSAAKFVATTFKELDRDCATYDIKSVTLVEVMGRDTGWLTAASALCHSSDTYGPDLIYCCERAFNIDKFLNDIKEKVEVKPNVLVAISEGIKNSDGRYISDIRINSEKDMFGHKQNSGCAKYLEGILNKNFPFKVRSVELNVLQRCASHLASKTDILESVAVGEKSVDLAIKGYSNVMVSINRCSNLGFYEVDYGFVDVSDVANKVKTLPSDFIDSNGVGVTKKAISYLRPLIEGELDITYEHGLPVFINLFNS